MSPDRFEDHAWADIIPADLIQLYAPYQRETYVGPRPALVLIDLYNLAYRGGPVPPLSLMDQYPSSCGIYAHNAIEPTRRLIAAARTAGVPIFYCTSDNRPMAGLRGGGATRRRTSTAAVRLPDDFEIWSDFAPQQGDVIIRKQRASIFQGTPLLSHLNLLGVQSLIVCGESTSGCVRASCIDGYSNGLHVSLVEECTYDRHELVHKMNLFDLHHKYADVMHVEEVVAHLEASHPTRAAAG
ncbi:isochorismatase family protein [Neorhizobium petrolearium]|uniref:Isochorismatase family protein n=1 Tax=Neorhizobium petrolearium TaxID=515361 RepID=A0ABY8MAE2_9HYPH|nr:isochorismatase family protein [Neorhizobium petrolearium]MCC2613939.1 isochorismatase family protein [Neorhizobium petrolearium]WGI71463.1 isochorismatase family protein [Neorhizobium petrolearium]